MSGSGTQISAIQVTVNSTRLVRFGAETAQGLPSHFVLRPGEALLLVAHPRAWGKHVLSVVDRSVTKDLDDLDQHIVLGFCGRIETLLQADGSASLVIYRMPRDTDVVDLHDGPAETGGYMRTFGDLDASLTSSYLEFFEETGQPGEMARADRTPRERVAVSTWKEMDSVVDGHQARDQIPYGWRRGEEETAATSRNRFCPKSRVPMLRAPPNGARHGRTRSWALGRRYAHGVKSDGDLSGRGSAGQLSLRHRQQAGPLGC